MSPIVRDFHLNMTVSDLVLMALISNGCDHRQELVAISGIPERSVYNRIAYLEGKGIYRKGRVVLPPFPAMVQSRLHPHIGCGCRQFLLTEEGQNVLASVQMLTATAKSAVAAARKNCITAQM